MQKVEVQLLHFHSLKHKQGTFLLIFQQTLFRLQMDKSSYNLTYSSQVYVQRLTQVLSVSRVGGSAQIKAMKKVAGTLRLDLASYRELESFAQFGSDLDEATQAKLDRGARTVEVLKQDLNKPIKVEKQVAILYALTRGFLDDIPVEDIRRFEAEYL